MILEPFIMDYQDNSIRFLFLYWKYIFNGKIQKKKIDTMYQEIFKQTKKSSLDILGLDILN